MDHETLILAAIAIGKHYPFIQKDQGGRVWEPHLDDGDAMRLSSDLELNVYHAAGSVFAEALDAEVAIRQDHGSDKHVATRRAIVRAAAEIGEMMFTENLQTEDGCPIDPQQSVIVRFTDGLFDYGIPAGAWHESWNTSRQIHIESYWIVNDE